MEYNITGRHLIITKPLRDFAENKLEKLDKYVTQPIKINIILSVEKHRHAAEVLVNVDGHQILAKEETHEMYQSIDMAISSIERQFKKYKDKLAKNNRDNRSTLTQVKSGESEWKIKTRRPYRVQVASLEDAVMTLLSDKSDYLLFLDEFDEELKILYKGPRKRLELRNIVLERD